ncbi:MAG TPA: hypothetical protein VGL58_10870 [Caulobacteraceae bacterium]|jgi:hypothetical protein
MRQIALAALALAFLAGCATPYGEMGAMGGVRATRLTEDTVIISAQGNGYTAADTIQAYALRRAAEETVSDGYDLFRIEGSADRTRQGAVGYGSAYGGFASVYSQQVIKPGESLTIKMLHGPAPSPMPDGEYDARELIKFLSQTDASADHKNCVTGADGKVTCQ